MAEQKASQPPASVAAEDQLPINKTSNTVYIVAGAAVVVILGLVFGLSGGDGDEEKAKAAASEQAASKVQGMTKEELTEQAEHIKRTQAALIAAEAEEQEEASAKAAAEPKPAAAAEPAPAAAGDAPKASASAAPKAAPKPAGTNKKQMDSLDGLGSDITSALK